MTLTDDQKRGIISTALFHAVILLILIFLGLSTPVPNPQEEGISIDFGYSVTGLGEIEPSAAQAPEQSVFASQRERCRKTRHSETGSKQI